MCPGANGQVGRLDVPPRIVHQVRQVQQQFVGSGIEPQSFAVDRLLAAPAATQGDHHRLGGIAIGVMRVQDAGMAQRVFGAQAKRFRLLRHGIHGKGVRQRQAAPGLCGIRRDPGHMLEHAGGLCGRFRAASPDGQLGLLQQERHLGRGQCGGRVRTAQQEEPRACGRGRRHCAATGQKPAPVWRAGRGQG